MTRTFRALAVVCALVLAAIGTAGAQGELVEDTTQLFLANSGTDCGAGDAPYLTTEVRTTDINCGFIGGGLPFGEVFHSSGAVESGRTFTTRNNAGGVPLLTDASRDVEGVIVVRRGSQQGVGLPGGGQVVADIAMRVRVGTQTVDLGAQTLETMAVPGEETVELPFTIELPDTLQGLEVTRVELDLNVRGWHVWHGFMQLNGASSVTVPTLVTPEMVEDDVEA
jgi:hypothetical protein